MKVILPQSQIEKEAAEAEKREEKKTSWNTYAFETVVYWP